jgi:hypothetical protein
MDRSNTAIEIQSTEAAAPAREVLTSLSDLQLLLVGGGIGDTTL